MIIEKRRILNDYIEGNKRQYVIPVYQRNYEWDKERCVKLFEDIIMVSKKDVSHFCGSIVTKSLNDDGKIISYVIIDGQQRLTTIYIMLKALLDCAETEKDKDILTEALFNTDKYDEFTIDIQSKLKLKPIKEDNEQLYLLMTDEYDKIIKSSGIWKNYNIFKSLIENELSKGTTIRQIYDGLQKLTCAQIVLDQEDNAQEIFDRINSTGMPLSLSDKIRNFVLMTEATQEKLYENYWRPTEELFTKGSNELNSFFIDYINYKSSGQVKESEAYDKFREIYINGKYTNETVLQDIAHYANLYHNFLYADCKDYNEITNYYLCSLQKIKQTTVFMFMFDLFTDFENKVLNEDELDKILHFLLSYSVKRGICEIGSNSLRGLYRTLYSRVFINEENKAHYYDAVVSFFEQLNTKDAIPTNENFITDLKEKNLYPKKDFCKYILSTIENDTKDEKTRFLMKKKEQLFTDTLSIEHVMPQNKNISKSWQDMLGENWSAIHDKYLHTLGNLTITGYNSELGDKSYTEKQQMMNDIDAKAVLLNKEINEKSKWNEDTIVERAKRLANIAFELFDYEKPATVISFADPDYHEYSCEDEMLAKNKKPNYFILQGEKFNVSSFAEITELLIEKLYTINPQIIEQMAKTDEMLFDGAEYAMFSYNPGVVRNGSKSKMIKNTNIYEGTGFSAQRIMLIVQKLLNKYDIDFNDFIYSAKDNDSKDSNLFLDWAKHKTNEGVIVLDMDKSIKSYTRFKTNKMSQYIIDTNDANSSWKTKNHYFYEVKVHDNKFKIQLSLNSKNASKDNMDKFIVINELCGNKDLKDDWIWKTVYTTKPVDVDELTDEQVIEKLDEQLDVMLKFENELFQKIELNQ